MTKSKEETDKNQNNKTVDTTNKTETTSSTRTPRKPAKQDVSYKTAPLVIPGGAVVLLSRIPHGFYEPQLTSYLSQFGSISRLRLSRNPRTGASRHYAFVEFHLAEVAKIVCETMHNYLLSGHLLQCKMVPADKLHAEVWKGANRKFVKIPWRTMELKRYNGRENMLKSTTALKNSISKKKKSIKIDYDFDNVIVDSKDLSLLISPESKTA